MGYDIIVEIDVETRSSRLRRRGRLWLADERLHEPPFLTKNYLKTIKARLLRRYQDATTTAIALIGLPRPTEYTCTNKPDATQALKQLLPGRIRGDVIFCLGLIRLPMQQARRT
jgi:hypothetical protein